MSRRRFPDQSTGLFPQDGSLPFKSSVISPKPSSCSDSAHAYLTTSASASAIHCDSGGRVVIPSGHQVTNKSRYLLPLIVLLQSEILKKLGSFQSNPSSNIICPVVGGGGNSLSPPSYSDSERDVVHATFSVTTATHDSGGIKGGDQPIASLAERCN